MARVTVEDCIERIPNRFDLVLTAAQRARAIQKGELLTIDRDNDKNPVVALREIAAESIDTLRVQDAIVRGLQRLNVREEELVEDEASEMAASDLSEMVGNPEDVSFGESDGMQVGSSEELDATGFEDADFNILGSES